MVRRLSCILVVGFLFFYLAHQTFAVIKVTTPLKVFLEDSNFILLTKVEQFYPEKPALILNVQEDLKGKTAYRRLPVVIKIDKAAENENYVPAIMKRLAVGKEIILFIKERGKKSTVFGFTNGAWLQMAGERIDADRVVWSLISGEPVLRQTFKGTTAEMRQLLIECLAGKKKPPEANEKEKPGFGPEEKTSRRPLFSPLLGGQGGMLFGVIPTLGIGGPLAILAILFPTVFGGVLVLFRQWMAFFTVLSINSTIYLLYLWLGIYLRGSWWGSEAGLWFVMTLVTLLGTVWAWSRQVYNLSLGSGAVETPRKTEAMVLWTMTALCGGFAIFLAFYSASYDLSDYLLFVFAFGLAVAAVVHLIRGRFFTLAMNPGRSTEGVILSAVLFAHLGIAGLWWGSKDQVSGTLEAGHGTGTRAPELVGLRWQFKAQDSGLFVSSPLIDGDRIYAAAASPGFKVGTLYCLDRATGKKIWEFIGDGDLKNMISSPCLADGRLYIGEGFHDDPNCKLWCVDAATGSLLWNFQTKGQTESSPTVVAGKVYFGAGNEGLYCLDALTGKEIWRFPDQDYDGRLLRFGAGPTVVGDRLFAATGVDRNKTGTDSGETALFCLDAQTGKQIWKAPTDFPAWGAPVVSKDQIYLGVGTGDVFEDAKDSSMGVMYCFDANTGVKVWQRLMGNGILDRPSLDENNVYIGCRCGHVYCLDRKHGNKRWKTSLDSPVVATPALAQWCGKTESIFAVGTGGKVCCLNPQNGAIQWTYNLTNQKPHISAAPKVVVTRTAEGDRRQLYFGAGIGHNVSGQAVLFCLEDKLQDR